MAALGRLGRLRICSAGVVGVVSAMVLPVLLGFTSLGVEVGHWYLAQRQMQGAADAAAISAAAQYIADYNAGNGGNLTYQTVGVNYANTNGFTIPTSNVCLVTSGGDNCGTVRSLDSRTIVCVSPPCVVVEITQNTLSWLTTQKSVEPGSSSPVQSIPTPVLKARAIVSAQSTTTTTTTQGTDCILALANDASAVTVHGNGDIRANCGLAVDGGRDQNVNGTPLGGISFNGSNAAVHLGQSGTPLVVAANSTGCPSSHCFYYSPSTTLLPASAVKTNTATQDPYAATLNFPTPPSGVQTGGVAIKTLGTGYTNGTRTFTVVGGTFYGATNTPATFTATVSNGKVTAIRAVTDPGAYTAFPTGSVSVIPDTGGGSGATFTLTEGCFTWSALPSGTPIAGRKYCSITPSGNFPAGSYYIAGGDGSCVGFCVSGNNTTVTSDDAGVTFFLTNGEGNGTYGTSSYATINITSGTISLCAPGTNTGNTTCTGANPGTTCDNTKGSCMLFVQNPAAPNATNTFAGNGTRTLSGLIYLPSQTFSQSGNGPILGCVGIIAKYIDVGGTPTFSNGCLPGHGIGGTTTTTTSLSTPYLYQ